MAACENCGKRGFEPNKMTVDPIRRLIICTSCSETPCREDGVIPINDVEYGIAVSSKAGISAYVQADGFEFHLRKTAEEIKKFFEEFKE